MQKEVFFSGLPTLHFTCTYRCHSALPVHFRELYVQKNGLVVHSTCTYRLDRGGRMTT